MPLLGFGTWQLRGQEAYDAVRDALRIGYRHLDTATAYGNETQVGRALRESDVAREDVFVTTKLPPDHAGRERETIEASLRDLGTDYVDLWLIHWPPNGVASPETWRELLTLQSEGKARAVGVSNYSPEQVDELIEATGEAPAVNQIRWSPAIYDPGRLAHSRERGVALEGYSPFRASNLDDPTLREIAAAHGVTPGQVVLRWHVEHGVVVIPKSARRERIEENSDIFGFRLDDAEVRRIDALAG
jgi:2,5-diketo-D-gluconate reductase A